MRNRRTVLRALQLVGSTAHLDFGDAMIVAQAEQSGVATVYTYDTDFDRAPGVMRREP